jgi:hypothetical protein
VSTLTLLVTVQEWQSPAAPAGLTDPEVDRYQPQGAAQQQPQQAAGDFAYPEQQTMPDYLTGAPRMLPGCALQEHMQPPAVDLRCQAI